MTGTRLKVTPGEYIIHPDGRVWKLMGPETEAKD